MRNAPEFALADHLTRVLDHGSPTVVESDEGENTGVSRDTLDFSCFCGPFSYRLFAEDVFAGCRRCGCEFQVPMVGGSDVDDLHLGIANHILPQSGVPFEPETLLSFLRTSFDFIGADDEPGSDPAVGEAIGGLKVRSAVCRPHPACSDNPYADDLCHAEPCHTFSLKQIEFRMGRTVAGSVGVRKHCVANDAVQIMTGSDELAERSASRCEGVEFVAAQAALVRCATEIDELSRELIDNVWIHRLIDAGAHLDIAGVEADLPGVGRRDDDVATDQFAPMHVVAKRRREQPDSVAALPKNLIGLFEYRHPGPFQITRIDGDVLFFAYNLEPIVETSNHD